MLTAILITNAAAYEGLPITLSRLVPGWLAVVISTTLMLFVGEIMPSAICSGPLQMTIATKFVPVTKVRDLVS